MILKDIFQVEANKMLHKEYESIYEKVKDKYTYSNTIEDYTCENGYARNTYVGQLKKDVKISELELSMLLDSGFSHFGGYSSISSDGHFTVVIYTD